MQHALNMHYERMRAAEHALRGPFNLLERRHGLAEIVERGAGVHVERRCVKCPHPEREIMRVSENASRQGNRLAQQRLGFFEAFPFYKGQRVVDGCYECIFIIFAMELQISGVYVSLHAHGLFVPSKLLIRHRKIALNVE